MDDLIKRHAAEHIIQLRPLGDIRMNEGEGLGSRLQFAQGILLDGRIVEIVQVIQRTNRVPVCEQAFTNMRTNEPHAASDQHIHGTSLAGSGGGVEDANNR